MADCKNLDLAREWAEWVKDNPAIYGGTSDRARAAADLISSLPDEWVSVDELRKYIAECRAGLATAPRDEYGDEILDGLEDLLPAPPASEPAAPRPEDVPEFDPAYLYRDKDGDTWEFLNHNWRCADYGRDATNYLTPPAKYRPYTRITKVEA